MRKNAVFLTEIAFFFLLFLAAYTGGRHAGHNDCHAGPEMFNATFATNEPYASQSGDRTNQFYISVSQEDLRYIIYRAMTEEPYRHGRCDIHNNLVVFHDGDSADITGCLTYSDREYHWLDKENGYSEVLKTAAAPTVPHSLSGLMTEENGG